MRRLRRVKIIATLGPATTEKAVIAGLVRAGADVFRINMSHTDHAALASYVQTIREIEAEMSQAIGILADLQGPKLRIGAFDEGSVHLRKGDVFVFDSDPTPGNISRVRLPLMALKSLPSLVFFSLRSTCTRSNFCPASRRTMCGDNEQAPGAKYSFIS